MGEDAAEPWQGCTLAMRAIYIPGLLDPVIHASADAILMLQKVVVAMHTTHTQSKRANQMSREERKLYNKILTKWQLVCNYPTCSVSLSSHLEY